ncbi:Wzz/FepE/Etk N-terminal domain-containing protein [Streptacidiphilus sp. P02-A3a]|uniref:Wzz/FepE/Etk N-terminal domain-containing protein n=1 Tax=Streptacidiphilus sp. P02-A3a TaxID=2704468 RepID=UPI001CDBBD7A|nr:Wzz/FepE/Etk N-terminal domain-containing protein [Streptacidiphilus sp. P02-A3a]
MDLAEISRVVRRRWRVLLSGLLVTGLLAAGVFFADPTKYQSQSTVELLNSQKATVAFDGNPFLSTQVALTGMVDSLSRNLDSDASQTELAALGVTGTPSAMIANNALAPLMWLTVTGTNAAQVLRSDQILTSYARQRLQQLQAQQSVDAGAMIRMMTIVAPQKAAAQTKTKIEYLVLVALLGLVVSLAGCFYAEARSRPLRHPRTMEVENSGADPEPGPTPAREPEPERGQEQEPRPEPDLADDTIQFSVL